MNICLISPPTLTDFDDLASAESEAVRLITEHAPLGILSLAAVLERIGHTPHIVDLNWHYYDFLRAGSRGDFCSWIGERLESRDFDVFGLGTICSGYPLTIRLARQLRRTHPRTPIILGGPQASVVDVATLRAFDWIDGVLRGEAEETFPLLIDALGGAGCLESTPGLTYRRKGTVYRNPNAPVISNLDGLPMPAFHLYPDLRNCRYVPLELGRGCPFSCSFCSTNDFFRRNFRLKSPQTVLAQMRYIRDTYNISRFDLVHDMFTVDQRRVESFCHTLLASGENFRWNCSARTDCIDDDLIALMARAGCKAIFFGIETGSPRLQKAIDKGLDLEEAMRRIEAADRERIHTTVSLISGFPEETLDDLRGTAHFFVDSLRCDSAEPQFHILAPLAETPIHARYRDQLVLDDVQSDVSYHGWKQELPDRALIAQHPGIFPNFYAVPIPGLSRPWVKELREFLLFGAQRFRWLLVALHQSSGDILEVFDAWLGWRPPAEPSYPYRSIQFRRDFLNFVRDRYLPESGAAEGALLDLLICEEGFESFLQPANGSAPSLPGSPHPAPGVGLLEVTTGYPEIIRCLKRRESLSPVEPRAVVLARRRGADDRIEVLQLSPLSGRLMKLSNGTRTLPDIAEALGSPVTGVSPDRACMLALEILRQDGLLVWA